MSAHTPRTFEVPAPLVAAGYGPVVDLDVLDREVEFPGEFGEWAESVLYKENSKVLEDVCGEMRLLPRGILSSVQLEEESYLVAGLVDSEGRVWDREFNAWGTPSEDIDIENDTVVLDDDEVAYVARALREGADEVWFRPYVPKAFVSAVIAAPPPPQDRLGKKAKQPEELPDAQEIPAGSAIVAVVDPIDEDAVLEMLAITPGPRVLRRHDGSWFEDPEWVPVLTSVRPPKIVKLAEAQVASVTAQVDRSTNDQDWEPFETGDREQYQIFTASVYLEELLQESQQKAMDALLAVAGKNLSPQDMKNTERLKRYWTIGEGAAKIRWGTPGSWRRCYRHLVKYVGPKMAPGLCTNLSQRLGGPGVATHVTSSAADPEAVVAANPSGKNGYDSGMTFEESTNGVERDSGGKFAPESGSQRGRFRGNYSNAKGRAARRRASMAQAKKAREEKENKKSESGKKKTDAEAKKKQSEIDKAKREAERAKKAAQAQVLADISLQISEAGAAGDYIRAAELRIARAEKQLEFADTAIERTRAQATLNTAKASLRRAQEAAARKRNARSENAGGTAKVVEGPHAKGEPYNG